MKVTMKRMIASVLAICTIYSTTAVTVSAASTSTAISQSASECAEQNLTSGDFEYRDTVITNRLNGSVHFTVNGAKIQSIDSSNIRLGWDFAVSSDVSVQIDDNRKGFTVHFLVDMQTTPNEMGLIKVDGATIIKDGEVKNISQEFQIAHGYEPNSVLAEIEKDDTVERIAKGILKSSVAIAQNAIGKKIYTLNDDKVISSPTYGFCAWLTDFLGEETVQLLTGEEDDGISRALESMEANLRREINNSTDALKSEMQDVYKKLRHNTAEIA